MLFIPPCHLVRTGVCCDWAWSGSGQHQLVTRPSGPVAHWPPQPPAASSPDCSIRRNLSCFILLFLFCLRVSLIMGPDCFIRVWGGEWWPLFTPGLLFRILILMMMVPESRPWSSLRHSEMTGLYSEHTLPTRVNYDKYAFFVIDHQSSLKHQRCYCSDWVLLLYASVVRD